jgi:hypothetical protein
VFCTDPETNDYFRGRIVSGDAFEASYPDTERLVADDPEDPLEP